MRNGTQPNAYFSVEAMSALGQRQTFAVHYAMSALPPKADMCGATSDVRFVPIADIRKYAYHQNCLMVRRTVSAYGSAEGLATTRS